MFVRISLSKKICNFTNCICCNTAGVTRLTWSIEIVHDNLETEPDERFKILLRNPTNALLGDVTKSVVHVLNAINGNFILNCTILIKVTTDNDNVVEIYTFAKLHRLAPQS